MITITNSFPLLHIERLEAFEKELGIELPNSYKEFLLTYNGGRPEPAMFPIVGEGDDTDGSIIAYFLGIKEGEFSSLTRYKRFIGDRVPKEFLPIAQDVGGNLVCLCTKGKDKGKIYFWDHEEESDIDGFPTYDNLYFVANDFEEFLNSVVETLP